MKFSQILCYVGIDSMQIIKMQKTVPIQTESEYLQSRKKPDNASRCSLVLGKLQNYSLRGDACLFFYSIGMPIFSLYFLQRSAKCFVLKSNVVDSEFSITFSIWELSFYILYWKVLCPSPPGARPSCNPESKHSVPLQTLTPSGLTGILLFCGNRLVVIIVLLCC